MELRYCEKCGDIIKLEGRDEGINPSDRFICSRCQGGEATPKENEKIFDGILDQTGMNLYSASTIMVKRKELEVAQQEKLQLEEDGEPPGSNSPARSARKLQFRCLHCRAMLQTRPVEKASRMVCPSCKGNLFIDASGIVSKKPPVSGDKAVPGGASGHAASSAAPLPGTPPAGQPKTSVAAPPRPPSVRVPKGQPASPPAAVAPAKAPSIRKLPAPADGSAVPPIAAAGGPGSKRAPKPAAEPREQPAAAGIAMETLQGKAQKDKITVRPAPEGREALLERLGIPVEPEVPENLESSMGPEETIEALDAELNEVEEFPEKVETPRRPAPRSRASGPGICRKAAAVVVTVLIAVLLSLPLFLAGALREGESGGPPETGWIKGKVLPAIGKDFRPGLERLGNTVHKGREAILQMASKALGK
jgi:hypothetical protein